MLLALGVACDAFDSDRQPYTPFPVASGTASVQKSPEAPVSAPIPEPAAAAEREVQSAPARAREWRVGERLITAPDGLVFRLALAGGLVGGSERDILAWLVGTPEKPVIGELWSYPEAGPPRLVAAAPGFLPTGPTCAHGARLRQTGPSSVTLDIKATCTGALLPRAPERSVSVLAPLRAQPLVIGFQVAAPAAGERLEIDVASLDRDADGRDDIELSVRAGALSGSDVRARFVWLERAAGLSRDMAEPRASFAELAELETVRANNHKSSLEVPEHVSSVRRLYASSCAESGAPRVFMDSGAGIECGDVSAAFETLTAAEVSASLEQGRVGDGFAALERHAWFPTGEALKAARFEKRQLSQLMQRVAPRRVIKLVPLKARPRALDATPHFSPLSFHADGSLLLLTAEGVVRAAPDGRFEYEASDEVDPWPTLVVSPAGQRLVGITFPCDRSEVSWLQTAADGTPLPPLLTELVAPRPGNCSSGASFTLPKVSPTAWSDATVSAFVGAGLLGAPPTQPPMGSAFSPNARFSVVATNWGLFVGGNDKPALWIFDDAALPARLTDCVVSNNAQAAACLLGGRAYVILPDPKSG